MRTLNITSYIGIFLGVLLLTAHSARAVSPPSAPPVEEAVELTGWLHVEDLSMADVVVTVEFNGEVRTASVTESGRFEIALPANTEAVVRIEKPGHLAKEVTVDTRHANVGAGRQRRRKVHFAVIMQLERHMAGLTYPGPVGDLSFDAGGGCLAVSHERSLVPAKRQATMVF